MLHRFANCELDRGRVVLRRVGHEVGIEPQAYDLLCFLLDRRGQVVRKEDLLDEVWGDRFVSESALTTQIKSVRRAVGDDGRRQQIIRTVHGKGYEFIAYVTTVEQPADERTPSRQRSPSISALPAAIHELIGRDALLDTLTGVLDSNRLVSLVGPGGVGKTSVAYELARRVERDFDDGVHLIELITVVNEAMTASALATALDVSPRGTSPIEDAVIDMLRPRRALLVLDNCEHVIESVAGLVYRVLRAAPDISILATSREPLAVPGEQVIAVDPLPVDGGPNVSHFELGDVPAVALFVARARALDPDFELDATTAPAVVEICRRLDGIPLAIELAAARTRSVDVAEIAARLDERFRLLRGIRRATDPRHRTLSDAISWSYDLLAPDEQQLFNTLAVFAGQFDLAAAEAVYGADDVLDLLTRLAERSMLTVRRPAGGGIRYELLETLREYGRQRLDDQRRLELFTNHASHYATIARKVASDVQTGVEGSAIEQATRSFAELRAAQRFAFEVGDVDTGFSLVASIREFAMRSLRYEALTWADQAAELPAAVGHPLHPTIVGIHGYGAWVRGEYAEAVAAAEAARIEEEALGVEPSGMAERVLANVSLTIGDSDRGMVEAWRQLDVAEGSGSGSRVAHACYMASVASSSLGAFDDARALAERARRAATTTGSPTDLASAWLADGFAAADDRFALDAFDTADDVARAVGNRWMSAFARTEAAGMLLHRGELAEGCARLAETVDVWYRAGESSQQWHTLTRCMIGLDLIGLPDLAAEVVGSIEQHAPIGSPPLMPSLRPLALETRASLGATLGADRDEECRRLGATRPLAEIVHRTRAALLGSPPS